MFSSTKIFSFFSFFFLSLCLCLAPCKAEITDVTQRVIMPGLIHHRFVKHVSRGPVIINVLEADTQRGFAVRPALAQPNTIWAKATLPQIVSREEAVAGVNANYFNNRGMPIGSLAIDREWITGPIMRRASVSIDKEGKLSFARPTVSGNLNVYKVERGNALSAYFPPSKAPQFTLKVDNINQPDSLSPGGISFYNHWWQDKVSCGNNRSCVLVDGNGMVRMKVYATDSSQPIQPTRTDYVLSALNDEPLQSVFVGDKVALSWYSFPDWSQAMHVVGGGPYLISKGEIILNDAEEGFTAKSGIRNVAPRTAIGMTSPGRLIFLTADGRRNDSVGLTLWELSALLKEIGVSEGINMDGGGSTTMVLNGQIVNNPSDSSGARSVSTALLLYKSNPHQSPWKSASIPAGLGGP